MKKVYLQVIDTRTGVYQTGMIEEPASKGYEISNALGHFGIKEEDITWQNKSQSLNIGNSFGEVEGTSKVVTIVTVSD